MNPRSFLSRGRTVLTGLFVSLFAVSLPATLKYIDPEADTWVDASTGFNNTGNLQSSTSKQILLRFKVTGVTGKIHSVKLRLVWDRPTGPLGDTTICAANNSKPASDWELWAETGSASNIPFRDTNAKLFDAATPTLGVVQYGPVDFDLSNDYITGNGVYSFSISSSAYNQYSSKEAASGSRKPQLVIDERESNADDVTYTAQELLTQGKAIAKRIHLNGNGTAHPDSYFVKYGVIDVTKQPYGAVHNGDAPTPTDDRLAIQRAINDAQRARAVVYLPAGKYMVSDTIEMVQGVIDSGTDIDVYLDDVPPDSAPFADREKWTNAREFGNALMGPPLSWQSGARAVLKLIPGDSSFNTATQAGCKPVLRVWSRSDLKTVVKDGVSPGVDLTTWHVQENRSGINYNQTVSNVDIDLTGTATAGAVGMELGLAQGGMISDCKITATGAFAGFYGSTGPGGGMYNLTVNGGIYGIYVPAANDGQQALVAACMFNNQQDLAGLSGQSIYWGGGLGGLTVVGTNIDGKGIKVVCGTASPWNGMLCLSDCQIKLDGAARLAIDTDRSVSMHRMAFYNVQPAITAHDGDTAKTASLNSTSGKWRKVYEYSGGQAHINQYPFQYPAPADPETAKTNVPRYQLGVRYDSNPGSTFVSTPADANAVPNYQPNHAMPESPFFLNSANILNVKVGNGLFNAVGNGVTDDWAAIQHAIDNAGTKAVFLPKGDYRLSQPLTLRGNVKMFGIHKNYTCIQSVYGTSSFSAVSASAALPLVVVDEGGDTANRDSTCMLADLMLKQRLSQAGAYLLDWKTGKNSVVKEVAFLRRPMMAEQVDSDHPMIVIEGEKAGGRFFNIWGVANTVNEGTPIKESGVDVGWTNGAFRDLLVSGSKEPLAFYMLNFEYAHNQYLMEMIGAENVNIYQSKWEGNYVNLHLKDCNQVRVFGMGGNTCPFPTDIDLHVPARLDDPNSSDPLDTLPNPIYLYNENATGVRWNESIYIEDSTNYFIAGQSYQQRIQMKDVYGNYIAPLRHYDGEQGDEGVNQTQYERVVGAAVSPEKFDRLRERITGAITQPTPTPGTEQFVIYKRGGPNPPSF